MSPRHLLAALSLLLTTALAFGDAHPHQRWTRAAVASLPVFHEDVGQPGKPAELAAVADAVAARSHGAPRPPREWAALELTVGAHESNLSSRIIANVCKPHECDSGRARGFGQVHRNALNGADWDAAPGNVELQAKLVDDALRRAFHTCERSGVPWLQGTLNAYAGRRCGDSWPGLGLRMATWSALVRVSAGGAS